jgi:hypothetical protein
VVEVWTEKNDLEADEVTLHFENENQKSLTFSIQKNTDSITYETNIVIWKGDESVFCGDLAALISSVQRVIK